MTDNGHTAVLNPQRVVDDLRELKRLTGDANGAQRLAWTDTWDQARQWLRAKLAELPVEVCVDEAGNVWATLAGASPRALILGSHIDSVPGGGWLDGCLGVAAGLEVLRYWAARGTPPVTLRLAAWAEEEGTQFGLSLFTSHAACGPFDPAALREVQDSHGARLTDVIGRWGVDLDRAGLAARQMENAAAYVELHIEQGPVLESLNLPLAAVLGTMGLERHRVVFRGQTAHAGSTPMTMRRDALSAAAHFALAVREIAVRHEGVSTVGSLIPRPGIVTAVAGECECTLDQRHIEAHALAAMLGEARAASETIAGWERVEVAWERLYHVPPVRFHEELTALGAQVVGELSGNAYVMPSGPLHDAVAVAQSGVPTAMLFVQSLRGLSHTPEEDTREADLRLAVEALERLAERTAHWIEQQPERLRWRCEVRRMADEFFPEEFDDWAESYDESVRPDTGFPFDRYSRVLAAVVQAAGVGPGAEVLDLGTGTGNLAELLMRQGCRLWGLDFSGEMLTRARAKLPGAVFAQADVRGPWPQEFERRYDAIVSGYTLHHFPLEEKVRLCRRYLAQYLKVGGRLVIGDLAFEDAAAEDALRQAMGPEWEQEYFWLADESLAALRAAGLDAHYTQISSCAGVFTVQLHQLA